jgi:cytochrome c oxidase subunit 2
MDTFHFPWMAKHASAHGAETDVFILYVHLLMAVLFVGWLAYFLFTLFRFRAGRNPKADYVGVKSHISTYLEGVVAVIEAVLLIGFAIPLWARAAKDFPAESDSTVIRVIAQQFSWNARYPGTNGVFGAADAKFLSGDNMLGIDPNDPAGKDDFKVINDIVIPVNKDALFYITSMDVIHGFAVHAMRSQQDAIPGLMIPNSFKPVQTGNYLLTCAQLCGQGHGVMRGSIVVKTQEEYDEWFNQKSAEAAGSGGGGGGGFE